MTCEYDHTQRGVLHYAVALAGGGCIVGALLSRDTPSVFVMLIAAAGAFMFTASCFVYLRVRDEGDRLSIRFGPVELFGTSIRYEDIARVERGRTNLLHGWGIHGLPFVSVTYNIHGYDCVRVEFKRPRGVLRFRRMNIGTDDPEGLERFLRSR